VSVIDIFDNFRDVLYVVLKSFQHATEPVLGGQSYWFSIVMLTVAVRIILIPLTVKQVRSTRVMQEIQPELKKLQAKYKNDKQKLQEELMKLYRERGFNPLAGCWPLAAQLPFFWALYRVIYSHEIDGQPNILLGKTFFGVPLDDRWSALAGWGEKLGSVAGITILGLIIAMAITTYISQRQLMAKQTAEVNPQQQMMLRIMPLMFLIFAINVPLAVVLYWVTTNLWSMGQQWVLLRNAPTPAGAAAPAPAGAAAAVPSDGGQGRKGLAGLGLFRGLGQGSEQPKQAQGSGKNGSDGTSSKAGGASSRAGDASSKAGGKNGRDGTSSKAGGASSKAGGKSSPPRSQKSGGKGGQARSSQAGRSGTGNGRKPGSSGGRPTGKGKAGGQQRRSKR
jgi:YidC/Oxa1 family membrane protein insertase